MQIQGRWRSLKMKMVLENDLLLLEKNLLIESLTELFAMFLWILVKMLLEGLFVKKYSGLNILLLC